MLALNSLSSAMAGLDATMVTSCIQDTATSKGTSTDDLDVEFALSLALITNSSERVRSALARALTADLEDVPRTTGPHSRNAYATPPAASPAWSASPYPRRATLVRGSVAWTRGVLASGSQMSLAGRAPGGSDA